MRTMYLIEHYAINRKNGVWSLIGYSRVDYRVKNLVMKSVKNRATSTIEARRLISWKQILLSFAPTRLSRLNLIQYKYNRNHFNNKIMYAPSIIYRSVIAESEGYYAQRDEVYQVAVNLALSKGLKDYQIHLYKGYGSNWTIDID